MLLFNIIKLWFYDQFIAGIHTALHQFTANTGGGGGFCLPFNTQDMCWWVMQTYHQHRLSSVHMCRCKHKHTHRHVNDYRARSTKTLFSQQQSLEMQLKSRWLISEKCSWMELQRQIIQMVFCSSASPRCSCFSGWISNTPLYSATWKETTKLRGKINRKKINKRVTPLWTSSMKKLHHSNTWKKIKQQLPVYTNKSLTVAVKWWLWNPHFFHFQILWRGMCHCYCSAVAVPNLSLLFS